MRAAARPQRLTLSWVGDDTLEARFPLQTAGLYLGAVQLRTGGVLPLAPLTLPYSPEFEPQLDPEGGRKTLREIARVTGGVERTAWDDVFSAGRTWNRQFRNLVVPLVLVLLLMHVTEIAGRRLLLFASAAASLRSVRLPKLRWRKSPTKTPVIDPAREPAAQTPAAATAEPASITPVERQSPLSRAKNKARSRIQR